MSLRAERELLHQESKSKSERMRRKRLSTGFPDAVSPKLKAIRVEKAVLNSKPARSFLSRARYNLLNRFALHNKISLNGFSPNEN